VHRDFASETVVLHLRTGQYHGLNPTGGRMLEVLQESGSVPLASTRLAEEYGRPLDLIEDELIDFCLALADRDLITVCED
jgi:hypothetical protein